MSSTIRKALSVLGVTASIVAGISLGGGTAMAAEKEPPPCKASLKPGWGCLAVVNKTKNPRMRSLRIGERGSCIWDLDAKKRYASYYAIPGVDVSSRPSGWLYYPGSRCDGGATVFNTLSDWSRVDKYNYVTVTVVDD